MHGTAWQRAPRSRSSRRSKPGPAASRGFVMVSTWVSTWEPSARAGSGCFQRSPGVVAGDRRLGHPSDTRGDASTEPRRPEGAGEDAGHPREPEAGRASHAPGRAQGASPQAFQVHHDERPRPAGRGQPARPKLRGDRPEPEVGGRHDGAAHRERQALPRRRARPVLEVRRRLGAVAGERPAPHDRCARDGHQAALPRCRPAPPLGPGVHLCQRGLPTGPRRARPRLQHEPARQPVRQRRDGGLELDVQGRVRRALPEQRGRQYRGLRLHRGVLQPEAATLGHRLRESGRVRGDVHGEEGSVSNCPPNRIKPIPVAFVTAAAPPRP